jgi:hypothetical protein
MDRGLNGANGMKKALLIACLSLAGLPTLHAADDSAFDAGQAKIVQAVTDDFVAKIAALKPGHPPLAKFGQSPAFQRMPDGFRYDFHVERVAITKTLTAQERPLPGGGIIFLRFFPGDGWSPMVAPPELSTYESWGTTGGARAGIGFNFSFGLRQKPDDAMGNFADPNDAALADALKHIWQEEVDGLFARLTSELVLTRHGVHLDVPSLLAAAETRETTTVFNPADTLSYNAFVALLFHPMDGAQWAAFRAKLAAGDYQVTTFSVGEIDKLVQEHAPKDRTQALLDLVKASLRAEQSGRDTFQRTPFTGHSWAGDAGAVREYALAQLKDGVADDIPIATLLLTEDSDAQTRIRALDYLARQPGASSRQIILNALGNFDRSVQAYAAQLASQHKLTAAKPALQALLQSPAPQVRHAAADALKRLGAPVAEPPVPPLTDSARKWAGALWQRGLTDDDIVKDHQLMDINTSLLPAVDRASVDKAIDDETPPIRKQSWPLYAEEPIPAAFLLAAAVRLKDSAAAARIYSAMCEDYENDAAALDAATDQLGWDRFAEGLNEFHEHHDQAALPWLAQVAALAPLAPPFSQLSVYIKQSAELADAIQHRPPAPSLPQPARTDTAAFVRYGLVRLRDDDGVQLDPAAEDIRQVGLPAVPYLLDAVVDRTPTRTFSYWRSYLPQRDFIYVGNDAICILQAIAQDYGADFPVALLNNAREATPASREKLRAFFARIPPDRPRVPSAGRYRPLLYPSVRYFGGDD